MKSIKLFLYSILFFSIPLIAQNTQTVVVVADQDAMIKSHKPENNFGSNGFLKVRTTGSEEEYSLRSLLQFDLESISIPSNAFIISAHLKLTGELHAQSGSGSNESYLQFVYEPWAEGEVKWDNQPTAGQENQIFIPSQGNSSQNVTVDLTNWYRVNHAGANEQENFGFLLRLKEEKAEALLSFYSKEWSVAAERPSLEIVYRIPSELIFSLNTTMMERDLPNEGAIESQILQGDGPFTFQWSAAANNSNEAIVSGLSSGTYGLTVTDDNQISESKTIGLGYDPRWKVENSDYYTYQSGILKKLTTNNWYELAESENTLTASNGWIEYTVRPYSGRKMIGFGLANQLGTNTWTAIGYGMYLNSNTQIVLATSGALAIIGNYTPGDILRLVKNGANFSIEKNGVTIPAASRTITSLNTNLSAKTTSYDLNTKVEDVRVSFSDFLELELTLTNLSDSSATDGALTATPSYGAEPYSYAWSNGATTNEVSGLGDGVYSVTVTDNNGLTIVSQKRLKSVDNDWNWSEEKLYDNDENLVGASKTYFDALQNSVQSQSKLIEEKNIMVSQTIYDDYGRAVVSTMAAPNFQTEFKYQDNFIKSSDGTDYDASKFDLPNATGLAGEVNNPFTVANSEKGSLGWYYSNNNNVEPYVATTFFPYSRSEYSKLTGAARKSTAPHDQLKMGSGHEVESYTMPVAGELGYFFGFLGGWEIINETGLLISNGGILTQATVPEFPRLKKVYKTISYDRDKKESIVFKDLDGKIIATALSGVDENGANVQTWPVTSRIKSKRAGSYVDIHVPEGCESSFLDFEKYGIGLNSPVLNYTIYDLRKDQVVAANIDGTAGSFSLTPGVYRIVDNAGGNITTIKYDLNYHQISLSYYDIKGNLLGTVSPQGFDDQFDASGLSMSIAHQESEFIFDDDPSTSPYSTADDWWGLLSGNASDVHSMSHTVTANPDPENDLQYTQVLVYLDLKGASLALVGDEINQGAVPMLPSDPGYPESGQTASGAPPTRALNVASSGNGIVSIGDITRNGINASDVPYSVIGGGGGIGDDDIIVGHYPCDAEPGYIVDFTIRVSLYAEYLDGTISPVLDQQDIFAYKSYTNGWYDQLAGTEWTFWTRGSNDFMDLGLSNKELDGAVLMAIGNTPNKTIDKIRVKAEVTRAREPADIQFYNIGHGCRYMTWREPITYDYSELESDIELRTKSFTYTLRDQSFTPDHTLAESYQYNVLNQIVNKTTINEGKTEYLYSEEGWLRFSQNEVQRTANPKRFSYTNYDQTGRVIESGEGVEGNTAQLIFPTTDATNPGDVFLSDDAILNNTRSIGLTEQEKNEPSRFYYDLSYDELLSSNNLSLEHPSLGNNGYIQNYLWGQLSYSENEHSKTIYGYDVYGRTEWQAQVLKGTDDGTSHNKLKTKDFSYTDRGEVKSVTYQKHEPTEYFEHFYTYDKNGRLKKTYTREGIWNRLHEEAEYHYYLHGPLKRVELANNLQGIDYIYNTLGYLKAINSPNIGGASGSFKDPGNDDLASNGFGEDVFGMALDYFSGDYARQGTYVNYAHSYNDSYSGNIKTMRWNTKDQLAGTNKQWMYSYIYNKNNWLLDAQFGLYSPACQNLSSNDQACLVGAGPSLIFNGFDAYRVNNLSYDKIGNIKTLRRKEDAGKMMDDFTYNYALGKPSCLTLLNDELPDPNDPNAPPSSTVGTDLEDQDLAGNFDINIASTWNYEYDAMGRMTLDKAQNQKLIYNSYGLVKEVQKDILGNYVPLVTYLYDENGSRLSKTTYSYDVQGVEIGVHRKWYLGGAQEQENITASVSNFNTIYDLTGSGRLGSYDRLAGQRTYELNDHLGNVRATVAKDNGNVTLLSYADYYPFGSEMPGRSFRSGDNYKHGYQGQFTEKDEEVNWDAFELRNWDGRLARWTTIDPYSQYFSPYLGMGNNPISLLDPDGGRTNPVYGSDKQFRGYDEFGAGGTAIIFDGAFTEGMSQAAIFDAGGLFFQDFFIANNFTVGQADDFINGVELQLKGRGIMEAGKGMEVALGFQFGTGDGGGSRQAATRVTAKAAQRAAVSSKHASSGQNIVGSSFDEVLPTQDWINPTKVAEYVSKLRNGEKLSPITSYRQGARVFIEDGHHRFSAYMQLGLKPVMNIRNTGGPVGYPNWLKTSFQTP